MKPEPTQPAKEPCVCRGGRGASRLPRTLLHCEAWPWSACGDGIRSQQLGLLPWRRKFARGTLVATTPCNICPDLPDFLWFPRVILLPQSPWEVSLEGPQICHLWGLGEGPPLCPPCPLRPDSLLVLDCHKVSLGHSQGLVPVHLSCMEVPSHPRTCWGPGPIASPLSWSLLTVFSPFCPMPLA